MRRQPTTAFCESFPTQPLRNNFFTREKCGRERKVYFRARFVKIKAYRLLFRSLRIKENASEKKKYCLFGIALDTTH